MRETLVWDASERECEPSVEEVADVAVDRVPIAGAIAALPDRQRRLIELWLDDPDCRYDELARRVEIPPGSVGPTLLRAFARLRRDPRIAPLNPERAV